MQDSRSFVSRSMCLHLADTVLNAHERKRYIDSFALGVFDYRHEIKTTMLFRSNLSAHVRQGIPVNDKPNVRGMYNVFLNVVPDASVDRGL